MAFNDAIIDKLSKNAILKNALAYYENKLAIFGQLVPTDAEMPYVKFYTSNYAIPTINQTVLLTVSFYRTNLNHENSKYIMSGIIESLDNKRLHAPKKEELRIYVSSNPVYVLSALEDKAGYVSINFIVRGAIKQWRII